MSQTRVNLETSVIRVVPIDLRKQFSQLKSVEHAKITKLGWHQNKTKEAPNSILTGGICDI